MKHQWLAYLIVALLSIGAGVAIAGLPDNATVDATIVTPTTTVPAPPTSDFTATTEPVATTPSTTESADTTPETTDPPAVASTTTAAATTTTVAPDLPPRSDFFTIVANGANVAGAAARNIEVLQPLGYTDIAPRNGTGVAELTIIYHTEGLEDAAVRLADDLDLLPEFVAPLADAPEVIDLPTDVQLLAYIGLDRAG